MVNLKLYSPLSSWFYRPSILDEEAWPEITMTEGIDVYEEGDKIYIKAAVPGIPADKIDITFEDGVLRISGKIEEKEEEKKKKKVVYRMDRVSSFDYTTTLPRSIDEKSIDANIIDGVLVLSANIAEAAKPKKIIVKTNKK